MVHSLPEVKTEANTAVVTLGFNGKYFVDADHINMSTVAPFVEFADFFTLDVASYIGLESEPDEVNAFISSCKKHIGNLSIPGVDHPLLITENLLKEITGKYLAAVTQASFIYQYLTHRKGNDDFIIEISMDEVEKPPPHGFTVYF
ncbi:MAG: hypothetical protein VB102_04320 [Paludibacter sp.]|nr:hypothetical protein [Paludibacter sp.]